MGRHARSLSAWRIAHEGAAERAPVEVEFGAHGSVGFGVESHVDNVVIDGFVKIGYLESGEPVESRDSTG